MNEDYSVRLGKALRRERKKAGFTQAQVAEYLGMEKSTISRMEHGDILVDLDRLFILHVMFGCSFLSFLWQHEGELEKDLMDIYLLLINLPKEKSEILLRFMAYVVRAQK